MERVRFRAANGGDAARLGAVHAQSWRETYAGLLPERLLNEGSLEARVAMWDAVLGKPASPDGAAVLVAESAGTMVGFAACGEQRDHALKEQGFDGEVGALYVLRSHQRAGIGTALIELVAGALTRQRRSGMSLWVLHENAPSRAFYEHLGGVIVGGKDDAHSEAGLKAVAYGWRDLALLAGRRSSVRSSPSGG